MLIENPQGTLPPKKVQPFEVQAEELKKRLQKIRGLQREILQAEEYVPLFKVRGYYMNMVDILHENIFTNLVSSLRDDMITLMEARKITAMEELTQMFKEESS